MRINNNRIGKDKRVGKSNENRKLIKNIIKLLDIYI